jgi:uncharacterized RDD family membrane protein YckC
VTEHSAGVEYVGFWSRVVASVIDTVLSAVILQPILSTIYHRERAVDTGLSGSSLEALASSLLSTLRPDGPLDVLVNWVLPAAAVIAFWVARQATPGKMVVRARIVDAATLGKPTTGQMIGRYLGYYVSLFTLGLGFFWVGWDPRKQGFHDKLAGTVVIRDPPKR